MQIKISDAIVKQQIKNAKMVGENTEPVFYFELKDSETAPSADKISDLWILNVTGSDINGKHKSIVENLKTSQPMIICGTEAEIESVASLWGLDSENFYRAAINVAHSTGGAVIMKLNDGRNLVTDGNVLAYVEGNESDYSKIARYVPISAPVIAALTIFDEDTMQLEIAKKEVKK